MNEQFKNTLLKATQAADCVEVEVIQSLWSGYGKIARFRLIDGIYDTVVVKLVQLPNQKTHPRGWNSSISHNRKVKSYEVECAWYTHYAYQCVAEARIPNCYAFDSCNDEVMIVLEDLDASGYPVRLSSVSLGEVKVCLSWLANFHACYMQSSCEKLWETGTYWHLAMRPEELEVLTDVALKNAAFKIDQVLSDASYQTLVHGDAKLANFCFSEDKKQVAAVDFQYVGKGCGMKDVAYFIGSCMNEQDSEKYEEEVLNYYFTELEKALAHQQKAVNVVDLITEWRLMYPVAWADFHRFLKGWSPGHWKINSYSERVTHSVISALK